MPIGMRTTVWSEYPKRTHSLGRDLGIDGSIILKWILNSRIWIRSIWVRAGTVSGSCEYDYGFSGYVKTRIFLPIESL
jgi:hypothetical protein